MMFKTTLWSLCCTDFSEPRNAGLLFPLLQRKVLVPELGLAQGCKATLRLGPGLSVWKTGQLPVDRPQTEGSG